MEQPETYLPLYSIYSKFHFMKYQLRIVVLGLVILIFSTENTFAQKKKGGTRTSTSRTGKSSSGYGGSSYGSSGTTTSGGNTKTTTNPNAGSSSGYSSGSGTSGYSSSGYGTPPPGGAKASTSSNAPKNLSLPIKIAPKGASGIADSIVPSLRNDNAIERNLVKARTPIVYEHIREDDAVYRQRVWREIDAREKINLPFRYSAKEDNGSQRFIDILIYAVKSGDVTVFNADDDRFTTPLTKDQVMKKISGGVDTSETYDINTGEVNGYEVREKPVEGDSIYRFRLKEEWIFDKESSRMFVRILGIAPIMRKCYAQGAICDDEILFWAYYPDLRPTLAKYDVYNGKNFGGRMSWEELFESRFFSSYITKSTLENPYDRSLKEYIKDPLFRLLEGENIKEKIFNYEQDLWSY